MANRNWLTLIKQTVASFLVAYLLSVAFQYIATDNSYSNPWTDAFWGIALYLAASLACGFVNLLAGFLYIFFDKGEDFKALVLEDLRSSRLPPPDIYYPKTVSWLVQLADDEDAPAEDRVKAATLSAVIDAATKRAGFFAGIVRSEAANAAILQYASEAPQRRPTEED